MVGNSCSGGDRPADVTLVVNTLDMWDFIEGCIEKLTPEETERLGATVGLSVKDRDLTTPPASPANGDRYLIPAAATGAWAGKANQLAVRIGGVWEYHAPKVGWLCYIEDEAKLSAYKPAGWSAGIAI